MFFLYNIKIGMHIIFVFEQKSIKYGKHSLIYKK